MRWTQGGECEVLAAVADTWRLRSTIPSPPGSRIEGMLESEPRVRLRVKVHGCRRETDGHYVLDVRPLDVTRELRTRIEALTGAGSAT